MDLTAAVNNYTGGCFFGLGHASKMKKIKLNKKTKKLFWIVLIIIGLFILTIVIIFVINSKSTNTNSDKHFCSAQSRNAQLCSQIYSPVCGYPIIKTYSNSCFACMDNSIEYYLDGEC